MLGTGFTLIDLGAPQSAVEAIKQAAEARSVPLKVIQDHSAESRDFYKATLTLVRPDQFVAWTSDGGVTDAAHIIRRAVGGGP